MIIELSLLHRFSTLGHKMYVCTQETGGKKMALASDC